MSSVLIRKPIDFVDDAALHALLDGPPPPPERVRDILAKSAALEPLDEAETAELIRASWPGPAAAPETRFETIGAAARALKDRVYGNRIVLFAPLYIGSFCSNDCAYCGFRRSNGEAVRRTLDSDEIRAQVCALVREGHKRLILVFGEHARYNPEFIAESVRAVYGARDGRGEIRRVNINAAPFDIEGFRTIRDSGIGTYQIFQETYHHATYGAVHPSGTRKADYLWRLDGLSRAMEAGCDDVGIGALFGLYDWRFEILALVRHARHLQERYGVGPHTISVPRLRPASGMRAEPRWAVSDEAMRRVVAILRLAVPYTGLILTAREPAAIRRELLGYGVSQIDAGSRIELGGYTEAGDAQCLEREQFELGDVRPLDQVIRELLEDGFVPSFCTACYRLGRTGEHFMEFAVPGFIKRFCDPNAACTLQEYLEDFASEATRAAGAPRVEALIASVEDPQHRCALEERLARIRCGERDLRF